MKVFKMNDCDHVCAETKKEAIDWYKNIVGEEYTEEDIEEIDVEIETMWYGFYSKNIEDFVDYCIKKKIKAPFDMKVGWRDIDINIRMTYAMALYFDELYDQVTPYIISSSEY
jgi:hypothetical protein